jgi:hypothetical protein
MEGYLNVRLIVELYNLLYLEANCLEGREGWQLFWKVAHPPLPSVANPLLKEYFIIEKNGRIVKILSFKSRFRMLNVHGI